MKYYKHQCCKYIYIYTFGAALALFHKIAAHASGLNHVINKGQTSRTNQNINPISK